MKKEKSQGWESKSKDGPLLQGRFIAVSLMKTKVDGQQRPKGWSADVPYLKRSMPKELRSKADDTASVNDPCVWEPLLERAYCA